MMRHCFGSMPTLLLLAVLAGLAPPAWGQAPLPRTVLPIAEPDKFSLLNLPTSPQDGGPVFVRAAFDLRDINEIDDEMETFEFEGVLTLEWRDERAMQFLLGSAEHLAAASTLRGHLDAGFDVMQPP